MAEHTPFEVWLKEHKLLVYFPPLEEEGYANDVYLLMNLPQSLFRLPQVR